jgi:tRNA A37 threonylcarbamoyladenosine dehydratase
MKKNKPISSFLKPKIQTISISATIPVELHAAVKEQLKKDGHKINDLILAAFQSYLEEKKL